MKNNIKAVKRKTCRKNRAVKIKSIKSKIPTEYKSFLKNGDSKKNVIPLHLDYVIKHKVKTLNF